MSDPLAAIRDKPARFVVGLNSGTSLDGIDAALVEIEGYGLGALLRLVAYRQTPFPPGLRERLRDLLGLDVSAVSELNRILGELFATAALGVLEAEGRRVRPDLVGSHGLTVFHRPPRQPGTLGDTLQIGEPSIIAERVGCPVVADFRAADVAAGGQGAPLAPFLDHLLLRHRPGTLALNLGGMGNLTWVGADLDEVRAFDTGPANLPLDLVARRLGGPDCRHDPEGRMAALGRVDPILLDKLMAHPYILARPPKTTGREEFGERWVARLLERHRHLKLVDILATLTAFAARAVHFGQREWLGDRPVRELLVAGGGVHNLTLMDHLRRLFDPVPVRPWAEVGFDADAKEAVLFAVLANERIFGRPGNVPAATGAKWPTGLGKVVW
ncbi:MAG: anhydro-N-acetylmuramic acid kinase [Planctomycetota bacterium]